ncbi:MAG: hypothetical protein ACLSVD_14450 [Eggerthellaceae bacterium]
MEGRRGRGGRYRDYPLRSQSGIAVHMPQAARIADRFHVISCYQGGR